MRILQLHNHHAGPGGGAMEVLAHEAELLQAAGHDVDQFTLAPTEQLGLSGVRAGAKAVWNVEAARGVRARIAAFRPDVVHVHTPFPLMSPAVFRAAAAEGVPAVTTLHSHRYSCVAGTCWRDGHVCEDCVGRRLKLPGVRHRCYHDSAAASGALTLGLVTHRALGTFHRQVSCYLALADFSRRLLIRDGFPADRVLVKPNSVPDPGFRAEPRTDERRLVFAARLVDVKGVATLLEAWRQVPAGMKLVIAGDGPLRPLVEQHASTDPSIEYVGWVGEAKVLELMAGAEAVLVPSEWYEGGLPLVALRSLSVGTPVVVTDLENICADVLADDVGWAFPVKDSAALAGTLAGLVADPRTTRERRRRARDSYERRFSPWVNLARLEDVYRSVTATGSGPGSQAFRHDRFSSGAPMPGGD
ncbi:glycosyltransferase family 4 protein [Blastococcus deserti]|uniref:Glycosyltransferase family 4 protein n=1 Tax=Blastococcus deserti TaxID=2259033 RepID=A0ABW4X7X1_9ACTN